MLYDISFISEYLIQSEIPGASGRIIATYCGEALTDLLKQNNIKYNGYLRLFRNSRAGNVVAANLTYGIVNKFYLNMHATKDKTYLVDCNLGYYTQEPSKIAKTYKYLPCSFTVKYNKEPIVLVSKFLGISKDHILPVSASAYYANVKILDLQTGKAYAYIAGVRTKSERDFYKTFNISFKQEQADREKRHNLMIENARKHFSKMNGIYFG